MKNGAVLIIGLFCLAFLLRSAYIVTLDNIHVGEWDDLGWELAQNLIDGKGYTMGFVFDKTLSFRPPLFPLFLVAIFVGFGKSILIARFFLALLSSINCIVRQYYAYDARE